MIAWNRDPGLLGQLAGMPLGDPRLSVVEGDVGDAIERAAAATTEATRFDAILLDVDNGPTALSTFTNRRLYTVAGLASARQALRGGGVLAVWSTFADAGSPPVCARRASPARCASWQATAPAADTSLILARNSSRAVVSR